MKTKFLLVRNVRLGFSSAIVTLLIVGAVSYHVMAVSNSSDMWVRHTHQVLENLQELVVAVKSVESSTRGFVLTGKEAYLNSSRAGAVRAKQVGPVIRTLTVDNPTQQRQLPVLERLVAEQIQLGESVIVLRQTQGQAAAADSIHTEAAQRSMGEFERVVREMQNEEMRLLMLRDAYAKRRLGQTRTVLILGTVLGLLITAIAGWSAHRNSSEGLRAEGSLRDSEEQYRGLLEAAPDAMVVVNQRGEIVLVNVQAEKQFGYNRDELAGQKVKSIIPEGFAERLIADALRSEEDALAQQIGTGIELTGRRKDGSDFPIEIMLSPLEGAEGVLVTAAIRDNCRPRWPELISVSA